MCLHDLIPKTCPTIYSLALLPRRLADEGAAPYQRSENVDSNKQSGNLPKPVRFNTHTEHC